MCWNTKNFRFNIWNGRMSDVRRGRVRRCVKEFNRVLCTHHADWRGKSAYERFHLLVLSAVSRAPPRNTIQHQSLQQNGKLLRFGEVSPKSNYIRKFAVSFSVVMEIKYFGRWFWTRLVYFYEASLGGKQWRKANCCDNVYESFNARRTL